MEIVCTFIFVLFILFVTGKRTQVADLGSFGIPAICLTLWALTHVDYYTAASMNPAIALAQSIYQSVWFATNTKAMLFYLPWYVIGAAGGGVLAGLFYLGYEQQFPERHEEEAF